VDYQTAEALQAFTQRYCAAWQQQRASLPRSEELYGVPSPCISATDDDAVFWQPQPFTAEQNISAVERALDIVVQQPIHSYYTTQFAGDMPRALPVKRCCCCKPGVRMTSGACRRI
jgi:SecY interacting protein Syd